MSYPVNCPACGVRNDLGESDLGVTLKCGSCAEPFTYGTEILAERKRVTVERKRQEREEAARIAEQNRAAAEATRKAADAERERGAAPPAAEYAPMLQPVNHLPPADYLGYSIVAIFLNLVGVVSVAGSIFAPLTGAFQKQLFGINETPMFYHLVYTVMFLGGFMLIACGHGLRMLTDIARNTAR